MLIIKAQFIRIDENFIFLSIISFYALMILEKKMNCILMDKLFEKKKKSVKSHLIFLGEIF